MLTVTHETDALPVPVTQTLHDAVARARARHADDDAQLAYVLRELRQRLDLTAYWIYTGGSHIAIHQETGEDIKGPRLALIATDRDPNATQQRSVPTLRVAA